mmetsp:Transcript_17637/g.34415  ORF Transcript_17637/g.34415 Transcript_17637/m.34415 type:complete len:354 (-) Transcript_17637:1068-2129(-)
MRRCGHVKTRVGDTGRRRSCTVGNGPGRGSSVQRLGHVPNGGGGAAEELQLGGLGEAEGGAAVGLVNIAGGELERVGLVDAQRLHVVRAITRGVERHFEEGGRSRWDLHECSEFRHGTDEERVALERGHVDPAHAIVALLNDEAADGGHLVAHGGARRQRQLGEGEGQVLVLEVGLELGVLAVRQNLVQVVHVARACLGDGGPPERARGEDCAAGRPAAVKPLQHVEEVHLLRALAGLQAVPVEAGHLEEAEHEGRLVLPSHRLESLDVLVLLDYRVLDVGPEAGVGEIGLPLGHQVVARAVRRRLRALVHEVGDVAPRELGDSELEPRGRHEQHVPFVGADGHYHVEVLKRE